MALFDADSQHRETNTVSRLVSLLPFWSGLCRGHRFRWFAINIPMRLAGDSEFTGEIDIIAKLQEYPPSKKWFYRAWEVKVALLCADGSAKSLKSGKLDRTLTQLSKYREFGSPQTSLLDVFLCEEGRLESGNLFPMPVFLTMRDKQAKLASEQFGFYAAVVEHIKDGGPGVALRTPHCGCGEIIHQVLHPRASEPGERFITLVETIDAAFDASTAVERPLPHMVFCAECKTLQRIHLRTHQACPSCGARLIFWGNT